jgi:peptide/nickel transport system substrate-binding protein
MTDPSDANQSYVNRRRFIEVAGISGATALAGCSGGSGNGNNGSNGSGGSSGSKNVYDVTHFSRINQVPTNVQWNPSNPTSYAQSSQYLMFDAFAKYNIGNDKFIPYAISNWSFGNDGKSFTMTIRDGESWANGDAVTADDIVTQLKLGTYAGAGYGQYTDSIKKQNNSTVVMHFSRPVNERIVKFQVLANSFVQQKDSVFGKYLDQINKNEDKGIRALQNFAWKKPIASGPFAFDSTSRQQLVTTRRDDHPDSDQINFSTYAFKYMEGNQAVYQAMIADQIDSVATLFTPPRILKQLGDHWQQVKFLSGVGYGLVPQFSHKHAGDQAVRQAIAYVLDRKQISQNAGPASKSPAELEAGILSSSIKQWIGNARSSFTHYGKSSTKTQKATQVLQNAGYRKQGGTWKDSDGQTVTLPVQVPSGWSDWVTAAQTVVDQLNSFGFKSRVDGRSFGNLQGSIWPNGNFVLASGSWLPGGGKAAFPYFSLRQMMIENYRGFTYNYPAANQSRGGSNKAVTVPKRNGSGTMRVNPSKRLQTMSQSTKQSQVKKIATQLAWVTNQDLPMIPVAEKQTQSFLTSDVWNVPPKNAAVSKVRWPETWLPRRGKMNYTGQ